jgi:maleate cis-trans isomerase
MASRTLLIVPANNTTMEPEINALRPQDAPVTVARVERPPRTLLVEDLPAYGESTLRAIEPFDGDDVRLAFYGCTAAGFLGGPVRNAEMVDRIQQRTGSRVVSTAGAMVDVVQSEDVDTVTLVSPYVQVVNDNLRGYFRHYGIGVDELGSFNCATTEALGRITPAEVRDMALRTVRPDSKALFIACSQLPTLEILPELRERLGIPVWSSIAATARMADLTD